MSRPEDRFRHEPKARPGDIFLFHRAQGLNRVITWFTRSRYYHVAIFAGGYEVIEARPRGVVRRDLRGKEGAHHYIVLPQSESAGMNALAWAESKIGDRYDHLDIFVIVAERVFRHLRINYTARNKFTCGKFIACAFSETGADLFPGRNTAGIVPANFAHFVIRGNASPALESPP